MRPLRWLGLPALLLCAAYATPAPVTTDLFRLPLAPPDAGAGGAAAAPESVAGFRVTLVVGRGSETLVAESEPRRDGEKARVVVFEDGGTSLVVEVSVHELADALGLAFSADLSTESERPRRRSVAAKPGGEMVTVELPSVVHGRAAGRTRVGAKETTPLCELPDPAGGSLRIEATVTPVKLPAPEEPAAPAVETDPVFTRTDPPGAAERLDVSLVREPGGEPLAVLAARLAPEDGARLSQELWIGVLDWDVEVGQDCFLVEPFAATAPVGLAVEVRSAFRGPVLRWRFSSLRGIEEGETSLGAFAPGVPCETADLDERQGELKLPAAGGVSTAPVADLAGGGRLVLRVTRSSH